MSRMYTITLVVGLNTPCILPPRLLFSAPPFVLQLLLVCYACAQLGSFLPDTHCQFRR